MVTNGTTGTFAYLFGDSLAKVGLAMIADPTTVGLNIFGVNLHGWNDTFLVFYAALVVGIVMLLVVKKLGFGNYGKLNNFKFSIIGANYDKHMTHSDSLPQLIVCKQGFFYFILAWHII